MAAAVIIIAVISLALVPTTSQPLHSSPYAILSRPLRAAPPPLPPAPARVPPRRLRAWCTPSNATCWPSPSAWAALNASLSGALVRVTPPLAPCAPWGAPSDAAACGAALANFSSSMWRASQPGASQEPNWEQDPVTGGDCFDTSKPCSLGNIPPFAVDATTDAHISAALGFAAAHNLRVVVKATGHEYQGRSAGADALLVWLHHLRGVATTPAFAACAGDAPRPALTARPGDSWDAAYRAAAAAGVTVVGGSERSVSACGGYTLGGGHSWTGPAYGMAVDNVLQFTAVLASGAPVVASLCQNEDLFWALRGGGGSSFAVVTSATYATHPIPAAGVAGATITVQLLRGQSSLAIMLDGFMAFTPGLSSASANGVVAGGYFIIDAVKNTWEILLSFNGTVAAANAALGPLAAWAATQPDDIKVTYANVAPFASLDAWHSSFDGAAEPTGGAVTLGSRLIPLALMQDGARRAAMAINISTILQYVGGCTGMFVAGGAVAALDPDAQLTSITPAWRRAGFHVAFGGGWALNATLEEQAQVTGGVSALAQMLRDGEPESGAYWSEADYLEPNWEDSFWGPNYARLQKVKAQVDAGGVFSCHHCVELP